MKLVLPHQAWHRHHIVFRFTTFLRPQLSLRSFILMRTSRWILKKTGTMSLSLGLGLLLIDSSRPVEWCNLTGYQVSFLSFLPSFVSCISVVFLAFESFWQEAAEQLHCWTVFEAEWVVCVLNVRGWFNRKLRNPDDFVRAIQSGPIEVKLTYLRVWWRSRCCQPTTAVTYFHKSHFSEELLIPVAFAWNSLMRVAFKNITK